jgi:hypothetical protein
MAKNVRVSDALYALAELEARLEHRSIAQQLEYWARHGMAAIRTGAGRVDALDAAAEATRRLDVADVRAGRRSAESLHFIPRSMVEAAELEFPVAFRRG